MSSRLKGMGLEGESDEWGKLVNAAREVCGEGRSRASNPWMVEERGGVMRYPPDGE